MRRQETSNLRLSPNVYLPKPADEIPEQFALIGREILAIESGGFDPNGSYMGGDSGLAVRGT
jgi:hypothetical protein